MIQTNDAVAALRFLIVARRVGLEVWPETGERRDYELECRSPELGEALWWLLAGQDELFDARLSLLDVQGFADERRGVEGDSGQPDDGGNYYPDFQPGVVRVGSMAYSADEWAARVAECRVLTGPVSYPLREEDYR